MRAILLHNYAMLWAHDTRIMLEAYALMTDAPADQSQPVDNTPNRVVDTERVCA